MANTPDVRWRGKTDQMPAVLIQALSNDICPTSVITGGQHRLADNDFGAHMGIECYPGDRDGITAAVNRAHGTARRQGDEIPTILVVDAGGSQVQQVVRQTLASGRHIQIYVVAAGPTSSAQAPDPAEITCIAHKTWGHRAIIHMSRIAAVGWPI